MASIVQSLNHEWSTLASSPAAHRALTRWSARHPELGHPYTLDDLVDTRSRPDWGRSVLRVLAVEAPDDEVAARTLLQAVIGGLVCLANRVGAGDPDALDEVVSLAWNRIRTYPAQRKGPVAANVLLDVRKQFVRSRAFGEIPDDGRTNDRTAVDPAAGPEDVVCERALIDELVSAQERGMVSRSALAAIFRTRLGGESLVAVAADMDLQPDAAWRRRNRAEQTLRALPLAG